MDTRSWPWELASRCLKTARQKKRAQKKDYQKKLIRLNKLRDDLWMQRRALPMVPLEQPYQRGWKRSFVVREDVARSGKASFYAELLRKINTVMHAYDKGFKQKKRRFRKRVYVDRPQYLRSYSLYEWCSPHCKLTETERAHFHLHEEICDKKPVYRYVFSEPWRFVLKVEPNMITHHKMVDEILEQQIAQLDNYISGRHLRPAMSKVMRGDAGRWRHFDEKAKYQNPLKHLPLHHVLMLSEQNADIY